MYVCHDTLLARQVAVKSFHNFSNITGLLKEIHARAKVKSKHVAEIYDCIYEGGAPIALIMEYVPGDSLDNSPAMVASINEKLRLLYQIACGLADMHDAGVIHRDIKPANMKVDGSHVLKIFDMGIANIDATSASTVGGAGTYVFRAPELYGSPPISVTTAADLYALGVVAWLLLGGKIPPPLLALPPQSSGELLPSLSTVVPKMAAVTNLLDGTLALNPHSRPSARQIAECIRARLTHDQRRAVISDAQGIYILDKMGTAVAIDIGSLGKCRIAYSDGLFVCREASGNVYINNIAASVGMELPDSCVMTFGDSSLRASRRFLEFNVSQPEVVL